MVAFVNSGTSPKASCSGCSKTGHTDFSLLLVSVFVAVKRISEHGDGEDCSVTSETNGHWFACTICAPALARYSIRNSSCSVVTCGVKVVLSD